MRPGQQNKRGRGRNNNNNNNGGGGGNFNRKGQNPLTRTYDSSGPDVKIRGTAQHIAEKYGALARDAQSSGDRVMAENYLQHAEHYNRIIAAAQQQMQERFPREDRDDRDDRQDYNERDGEDMDGSDDNHGHNGDGGNQQAAQSQPQPQPQQQGRQQRQNRPQPQAQPQPQPLAQPDIAGSGPQPVIEDMPAEAVAAAAEITADVAGERQPRRRNAGNRPRRQPRRSAGSDEGGEGNDGGEAPALADVVAE
ncbi:DUF4167 domain-containing protein [Rhizobium sp. G187]|uniref:DUF4167 domain-containing protein n=1 Tax=Rhizobium sp. G187 TaxID=3451352 RepID=UPI003EE4C981